MVVVYKESTINWQTLGRLISVDHYGLVNLVAGERVATELMQDDLNGERLASELLLLLDEERNQAMRARLREVGESTWSGRRFATGGGTNSRVPGSAGILPAMRRDLPRRTMFGCHVDWTARLFAPAALIAGRMPALPALRIHSRTGLVLFQFLKTSFQFFDLFAHLRQATDMRIQTFVFVERLNRNAPPDAGPHNLPRQHARF